MKISNYLVTRSLRSREGGRWFVFRSKPEKRTTFPFFASEASYWLSN
ncbi:MAG: hypothetical protein U5L45_03285 [Saprospiraceae bacterium]|nr:hypothetical protein [Saprospiraceae bacterium]